MIHVVEICTSSPHNNYRHRESIKHILTYIHHKNEDRNLKKLKECF